MGSGIWYTLHKCVVKKSINEEEDEGRNRTTGLGKEIPQGRGCGWSAWGLLLRERAGTVAGAGKVWPGVCPEASLTQFAQAPAGSGPHGPLALLGEFPAGISLPPAPWNRKTSALGARMAAPSGRFGRLCLRADIPENAYRRSI